MRERLCLTYVSGSWYDLNHREVHLMARCEVCGKEIEMKVFWKKYCGKKCRMDGYILKRAKELEKRKVKI